MRIPPQIIEEVRDRADIERVVGRSVRLQKQGNRLVGLCPFHNEKSPSFGVSREKQLYYCFGCQAGGNVFDFVMALEGLDFPDAVRSLAKEVGVTIPEEAESPAERDARSKRERLFALNAYAAQTYQKELQRTPEAERYLKSERGLTDETIQRFRLGWAPPGWHFLSHQLQQKGGEAPNLGLEVGLLGRSVKDGSLYDRLRGRVVFPIQIPGGSVAGFGARRADWVDPEGPKYLNSPESPLYDKSSILYGLFEAKDEIRKSRRAVLVEGYLDVIALHQAGLPLAVAACGTALTPRHAGTLARLTKEVVTLYDGDAAGQDATRKATEVLLREGVQVRVGALPTGEDPDTYVQKVGLENLKKLIDEAPSAIDFFVAQAKTRFSGGGIAGTTSAVEVVKPMILAIPDPLVRDVTIQAAARALGLEPRALLRHLSAKPEDRPEGPPKKPAKTRTLSVPVVEKAILRMVLETPDEVLPVLERRGAFGAVSHEAIRLGLEAARSAHQAKSRFDAAKALDHIAASGGAGPEVMDELRRYLMAEQPERDLVNELVTRLLKQRRDAQYAEIKRRLAEETDPEAQIRLLAESKALLAQRIED